jgi:hypothetical protein
MIKNQTLIQQGFLKSSFLLDKCVMVFILDKNWKALDDYFIKLGMAGQPLYIFLSQYLRFNFTEHIIAIRSAPDDEDGIWHDDGSRFLGYSLSLNLAPESIEGGELTFKLKNSSEFHSFSPLPYGEIVIFLSGLYGYEHKVSAVTKGQRIVIAGWCW